MSQEIIIKIKGNFTKEEYMQFNRDLDYNICGFTDLFPNLEIENPLWN